MARIPLLPRCLLNSLPSLVLLLVTTSEPMADVFTPNPPALPVDCAVAPPAAQAPSPQWLADYLGPKPGTSRPAPNVSLNGQDGIWWPPGQAYEYIGRQIYFDDSEVSGGGGFRVYVPDGELWRINWITVDWITNTGGSSRFFALNGIDTTTGFGYMLNGVGTLIDNSGGTVSFLPGATPSHVHAQYLTENLPSPLFIYSGWFLQLQIAFAGTDFLNTLRMDIERWQLIPRPAGTGTGSGGTGGTGGGGGGGYFAYLP